MSRQPGSYIEDEHGNLTPNLDDEAMAARQKAAAQPVPSVPAAPAASAAVEEDEAHDHA